MWKWIGVYTVCNKFLTKNRGFTREGLIGKGFWVKPLDIQKKGSSLNPGLFSHQLNHCKYLSSSKVKFHVAP